MALTTNVVTGISRIKKALSQRVPRPRNKQQPT
jgi:hypothetical protein